MPWNTKLQHGGCHVRMSNLHLRKCGPIIEGLWSSFRVEVEITRGWPDISACARASTMKGGGAGPKFQLLIICRIIGHFSKSNSDMRTQWLSWRLRQHPSVSDLSRTKTSATTQGSEGLCPRVLSGSTHDDGEVDVEVSPNSTLQHSLLYCLCL